MSVRSVIVRLEAEVAGYVAGFGKAAQATDDMVKKAAQAKKSIGENHQAMDQAGKTMIGFGATSVAALGASAKAAMDWESAWAGVTKTVDGSPEQMAALEGELRNLAKTLPATHQEIAAVAEAAGQLGVKRESVAAFTKTMVDLGETTNLTAEEAATAIAQIANVMGTAGADVDNFGASLVALGNAGASTEKEILMMAQRLAGAGKLVGATESDVLALANAMASVGIEAQLGGGVLSRVMQRMYTDVQEGGEGLDNLAQVAGVSSREFAAAFESDPVRAIDSVVKGLSRVKETGGNVVQTMDDLGIKGTEETSVILRLAGAGNLLSDSLELGSKAWKENTALANEAAKRYETTESKVKVAWNNIKDAAIDAGASLLPVVQGIAESVSGLAQTFGSLPAPVQGTLTVLTGVVGVSALLAGGLLSVIPKIADTRQAFADLNASGSKVPGTLGKIAKVAGVAAAAYAALSTAAGLAAAATDDGRTKTGVEDFNNALVGVATNGDAARKSLDGAFNGVTKPGNSSFTAVKDLDSALKRVFNPQFNDNMNDFWSTVTGQNATSGMNVTKGALGDLDKSVASLATSGNLEDAAAGFRIAADAAEKQKIPISDLVGLFPEYKAAILAAKTANGETQVSQEDLTNAMLNADPAAANAAAAQAILDKSLQDTGVSLDAVVEDMDKFLEQLFASGMITMSARDANAAYNEALRGIDEAMKTINESGGAMGAVLNENATDFNLSTEAGALANSAFQDVARKGMAEVEAKAKEGLGQDELQTKLSGTYEDLLKAADGMGITGQKAIDLARQVLGVPDGVDIHTWMGDQAKRTAEGTKQAIDNIPRLVVIEEKTFATRYEAIVKTQGQDAANDYADNSGMGSLKRAGGGAIEGPGTSTSDEVPIWASDGEHMLDRGDVIRMGGQQAVYRFREQLRSGSVPALAGGGAVGSKVSSAQLMSYHHMATAAEATTGTFEGNLYLDSGEFLGKVRGVARQEAGAAVGAAGRDISRGRSI